MEEDLLGTNPLESRATQGDALILMCRIAPLYLQYLDFYRTSRSLG